MGWGGVGSEGMKSDLPVGVTISAIIMRMRITFWVKYCTEDFYFFLLSPA